MPPVSNAGFIGGEVPHTSVLYSYDCPGIAKSCQAVTRGSSAQAIRVPRYWLALGHCGSDCHNKYCDGGDNNRYGCEATIYSGAV